MDINQAVVVIGAIAANRDELYDRPAHAPIALGPDRVGGRDDVLGGSWLAFTRDGRFAAVTNQREPMQGRAPRSRRVASPRWRGPTVRRASRRSSTRCHGSQYPEAWPSPTTRRCAGAS